MKAIHKKERKNSIGLWLFLTVTGFAELLFSLLIGIGGTYALTYIFGISIDLSISTLVLIFTSFAAFILTLFVNKRVLRPIRQLSLAMSQVTAGDFKVQLKTNSKIEDIKDIYEHFNIMVQALDHTEMLQSDFVSNVSHEFKTPINAIEGYAMLLQDTAEATDEQSDYVDKILVNTRRLSDLIGNILLLSKLENQVLPQEKKNFRLDEQIRQAILLLENQWEPKNIEFEVELDEVNYTGNDTMLLQVWNNLIGNAIKFSPDCSMVRITLKETDDQIICSIDDEGPGISEEEAKHIFDKFYQTDSSHKQEGNGLGLALVKRIIALSDGQIHVENLPDAGCRFTVILFKH